MASRFRDRADAGRQLAAAVADRIAALGAVDEPDPRDVIVLGLPRGGVPVAAQVAAALDAELDAFLVRKLGVPGHEELAMGAIASGAVRVLNEQVVDSLGIPEWTIDEIAAREQAELERRDRAYRGERPPPRLAGRVVVVVDDGLATGSTMRAAVEAVRRASPARVVVAVPTAPPSACEELSDIADDVIAVLTPSSFVAVGQWYDDFDPPAEADIRAVLDAAHHHPSA